MPANSPADGRDENPAPAQNPPSTPDRPTRRKKPRKTLRRLILVVFVLLVLLAVLIGVAPYLASTPAVSGRLLAAVNDRLQGQIRLSGLTLSWGGPLEVRGLSVRDPDGKDVLQVERIACDAGVWRLLSDYENFGELRVVSPRVDLRLTPDNRLTLADAFQLKTPSPPEPRTGPLPKPRGRLVIDDGSMSLSRADGASFEIEDLDAELEIDSLADLAGKLALVLKDGGQADAEIQVQRLFTETGFDPAQAEGKLRLQTDGELPLASLLAVLAPEAGLNARATLDMEADFTAGGMQARFTTKVSDLRAGSATGEPLALELAGRLDLTRERLTTRTELTGEAGFVNSRLDYRLSEHLPKLSPENLLAAVLAGEPLNLPGFELTAQAELDLAALERALPGILPVRAEQRLTGGKLTVNRLALSGGSEPSAEGAVRLAGLTASRGQRGIELSPVSLAFQARLVPERGLEIDAAELKSSFAQLTAGGSASGLTANFRSDLTGLKREFGQVFDLGAFDLAGTVTGQLELTRTDDEHVTLNAEMDAESLQYRAGEQGLDLPRGRVRLAGELTLAEGKARRLAISAAAMSLEDQVAARATGWYDFSQGAFQADVVMDKARLDYLGARAKGFGWTTLERLGGEVQLSASFARASEGQPFTSAGGMNARNLLLDGEALPSGDARISWTGLEIAPGATRITAGKVGLESEAADLEAEALRWQAGQHLALSGRMRASADVARCLATWSRFAEEREPPALAGRLALTAACRTEGPLLVLNAGGTLTDLVVGTGEQAVREKELTFACDARLDQLDERLTLEAGRLASRFLSAELSGTVERYRSEPLLALNGRYDASWRELTALLHELVPATADTVIVQGRSTSRFEITGPAWQREASPPFRGLRSALDVGWESAEIYGVPLGPAKLSPILEDGQVTLPPAAIPASQGRVNLRGVVDLKPKEPMLLISGKTRLLEDVAVTSELSRSLLSRINPIFLHLTRVSGTARLDVQDVALPLGESLKTAGAGSGRLDLRDMQVRPGGLLAELLVLGGLEQGRDYAVQVSGLNFLLKEGRLRYDDFTLQFTDTFDLKFYGSVGLDETLDLVVSLPISAPLLERLGVRGPTVEYARALAGTRVDIPMIGTREKPRLDFKRVDVESLVQQALEKTAGRKVDDLLQGLLGGQKPSDQKKQPKKKDRP